MAYDVLTERVHLLSTKKGESVTSSLVNSGVGKNFFYNLRSGSSPSTEKLTKIADYFNVSVDYLLGRADALTPDFSDMDVLAEVLSRLSNEQLLDVINKATARRQEK